MQITPLSSFFIQSKPPAVAKSSCSSPLAFQISADTVSFGSKSKQNQQGKSSSNLHGGKHLFLKSKRKIIIATSNSSQEEKQAKKLQKQQQKAEYDAQVAKEALECEHKMAELRKKYFLPSLKDSIEAGNVIDRRISFLIDKLKDYPQLMGEMFFEPDGGGLLVNLSNDVTKKILENVQDYPTLLKLVETRDVNGQTFMEKASLEKIKIFNEVFENMPQVLIVAYTTTNARNQLPAHYLTADGLKMMNDALERYQTILSHIYTSTDNNGNTPAHNRFRKGLAVIRQALQYQPETLRRISKIKNKYGEFPDDALKKAMSYDGPYKNTWNDIVNNF